ncbi:MAG: guanylate kinase [Nitrospiraceae bacterium]|nr:MAG: guanylate kinase [Nitrospiraceae bacterium]
MVRSNNKINKGTLFVISAPSGAGKTTLCLKLLKKNPDIKLSVSFTTRKPRSRETNNVDYTFVSKARFMKMIDKGEFAEWATVHGNLYGTSIKRLKELNSAGYDIILDIDTNGARQLKKRYENAIYIFILPPSFEVLKERLVDRRTDSGEVIARRLDNAKNEIACYKDYDYIVVNDRLDKAYRELESIVVASRLRISRIDPDKIKKTYKIK